MTRIDDMVPDGFVPRGRFEGAPFLSRDGPARARGDALCNRKICLVATDLPYLVQILVGLSEREDCYFVKYSQQPRDGMYLGRCFLTSDAAIGALTRELKSDSKLMVAVQDDDYFNPFRST